MKKTALVSVIHPGTLKYLSFFFDAVASQTNKEFDLVLFRDSVSSDVVPVSIGYETTSIDVTGFTIPEIRYEIIDFCIKENYDYIIWSDSDDYFASNRVEIISEKLKDFDIVVNDLMLIDKNNIITKENYFSDRIKNNQKISWDDVRDKNIFGFTNTAMTTATVKTVIARQLEITAVDWYIFSTLLRRGAKAVFTKDTSSYYRMHDSNIAGFDNQTNYSEIEKVRKQHFKALADYNATLPNKSTPRLVDTKGYFWWEIDN